MPRRNKRAKPVCIAALTALLLGGGTQAWASLLWDWRYAGSGVSAHGTFTTGTTPDIHGFYRIIESLAMRTGERSPNCRPPTRLFLGMPDFQWTTSSAKLHHNSRNMGSGSRFPTASTTTHSTTGIILITFRSLHTSMAQAANR